MVKYMITSSSKLLDMMIKNKHSEAIEKTAALMERIAVFAMKHHEKDILKESVLFLRNIGVAAARNKLDLVAPEAARTVQERIIGHLVEIKAEILKSKSTSKEFEFLITDIATAEQEIERYKRTIQQPSD